jgi:hypothetical protein
LHTSGSAWLVPVRQPQYRLLMSLFEEALEFEDSLFYDVSTWTKPLAFNMQYGKISSSRQLRALQGIPVTNPGWPVGKVEGEMTKNAWLFSWDDYYAPRALYFLQKKGLRTKVATSPFSIETGSGGTVEFGYGAIMVGVRNQDVSPPEVHELVREAAELSGITIHSVSTSLSTEGIHLGSGSFADLSRPEILMLIGPGTNSREAGEVWHLLDQRYHMPVTMVNAERVNNIDLNRYNIIVMVSGNYSPINDNGKASLTRWVRSGGNIIAFGSANRWLSDNGLATIEFVTVPQDEHPDFLPFSTMDDYYGSRRISGSIFITRLDITHPIGYGYRREALPYYVTGTLAFKPDKNSPFANPLLFADNALLSGYVWGPYSNLLDNSALVLVNSRGRGNIISFTNPPEFRAFWFGTNKLLANSIFFAPVMRR